MTNNLPLNWCECKFEDVLDYEQPTRYIVSNTDYQEQGIAVLTAGKSFILGYTDEKDGIFDASKETVIIFDDFTTASKLVDFPFKVKSSAMKILHAKKDININFLYYLMQTIHYESDTHKRYWISEYAKQTLNLPPLAEQERIVAKIEALFQGIDEGVERLKSAQAQIKQYRQSVLKSAFEGKLYKKNNNENEVQKLSSEIEKEAQYLIKSKQIQKAKEIYPFDVNHHPINIPDSWIWRRLYDVAFITKLAGFEYTKYIKLTENGEVPTIRAQNVRKYTLDETNLMYIDLKTSKFLERSALTKPAILITFIGAGIGDVALFDRKKRYHLAPNVAKVELFNSLSYKISEKYILYYLNSPIGQQELFKYMKATAQPSLSMGTIRDIYFPLCSLPEQQRIVEEIEKRFAVADVLEKAVNEGLEKADKLKQSILKKAFEGKLAPQNPNDEPASVLLDRIKKEQKPTKGKKK
ncbi:MAG: restriction endonuclease subunit S [Alphaproteobacteria bacterium]|nr:restriction endonuclease subunit S [Alphaproteobacteria bacterium]